MNDLIGKSFDRYHILERVGEGGMATVYKALDTRLKTDVAVKIIRTDNFPQNAIGRALKRFEREAKVLARLTHPNIVKVTDYGEYEGKPYLVMPYLPGGTLKQLMGKLIPWREAIQLLLPIAEALDYAHSQNMIHRDVKPANILLTERGQPMLTDFGIAKVLDLDETLELTGTSAAIGTPDYMAPEQTTAKTVDHRADIYALGVVFYEMVTGRKPFMADTPLAVLFKHVSDPLPSPKKFVPNLPDGVEKVLLKALAKRPADRYQSMGEMVSGFERLLGTKQQVFQNSRPSRQEKPRSYTQKKANSATVSIGISLVGLLIVTGLVFVSFKWAGSVRNSSTEIPTSPASPSYASPQASNANSAPLPDSIVNDVRVDGWMMQSVLDTVAPLSTMSSEITDEKGVSMVLVPAGEFTMGSENGESDEQPIHQVYLDAFYMDIHEVTNSAYQDCVDAGECTPPKYSSSATHSNYFGNSQYDDYPVIYVDWNQAKTYCEWHGDRLPTEAEWEKAARGTDGRTFPWGESINCDNANYNFRCVGDTTKVGSYLDGVSPYGLYDMAGNVWEWVNDWYDGNYYQSSPLSNPLGPDTGQSHGFRGGSWYHYVGFVRSAFRDINAPSYISGDVIGFRCARDARR